MSLTLDHITVVSPRLEDGVTYMRDALGVTVPEGGKHPQMSTRNCLMQLGSGEFLEIVSVDPAAPAPGRPRWFGLDSPSPSRLATWVLGTRCMDDDLRNAPLAGEATAISRGDLNWRISVPMDGSLPMSGAFPTLIEWPDGPHPSARMPDLGCRLRHLEIRHPQIETIQTFISDRLSDDRISLVSGPAGLTAEIETPSGVRVLT